MASLMDDKILVSGPPNMEWDENSRKLRPGIPVRGPRPGKTPPRPPVPKPPVPRPPVPKPPRPPKTPPRPGDRFKRTYDNKMFGEKGANKNIDQGFYDSDQYKNFSYTGDFGGMQTQNIVKSKYFGHEGSGASLGSLYSAMDRAYEDYLANREGGKLIDEEQPMTVGRAVAQGVERTPLIRAELRRRRKPIRKQTTGSLGTGGGSL